MIYHTTIIFKRDGETLGEPVSLWLRGRWLANVERKAMDIAAGKPLFRCATGVRILCQPSTGNKATSLFWLLSHTPQPLPRPFPEKNFA